MRGLAILCAVVAMMLSSASARADDCRGGTRSSLTAPQTNCAQGRPSVGRVRKTERGEPKLPPGTFRSGNTTITVRGSVSGEVTTRPR